MTKRKIDELETKHKLQPYVHFLKRGKPQRHELRVTNNTTATSAVLTVKATVTEANLTRGGRFGFYDVTLDVDQRAYKHLCDEAMRIAYKDKRVFPTIERINEAKFINGARHSLLKNGLFLKRKFYTFNGKDSEPKFYDDSSGNRIHPARIGEGSVIECSFQIKSYCVNNAYGLRGELEKKVTVYKLI
jgi:hypothetical protein